MSSIGHTEVHSLQMSEVSRELFGRGLDLGREVTGDKIKKLFTKEDNQFDTVAWKASFTDFSTLREKRVKAYGHSMALAYLQGLTAIVTAVAVAAVAALTLSALSAVVAGSLAFPPVTVAVVIIAVALFGAGSAKATHTLHKRRALAIEEMEGADKQLLVRVAQKIITKAPESDTSLRNKHVARLQERFKAAGWMETREGETTYASYEDELTQFLPEGEEAAKIHFRVAT